MISSQVIKTSIEELHGITKVDLCVFDVDGMVVTSTFDAKSVATVIVTDFAASPADSQVIGKDHLLKIRDEGELVYILVARGSNDEAYMIGKIAVCQIQNLIIAYKEHFDKNNFFQNLLLDNFLLVDIYNRAKRLHIVSNTPRVVYLVEAQNDNDNVSMELLKNIFGEQPGHYLTAVEQKNIIVIKEVSSLDAYEEVEREAQVIVDMMNSEAMLITRVSYGTIAGELKEVSKSYKEADMALEVGRVFYADRSILAYNELGIGRLIHQLPSSLCEMFLNEVFAGNTDTQFEDEELITVYTFFNNNLNISETARQLYVHRNTLVYRLEKIQKKTGLDVRVFEDALTFKIAMMVSDHMKYIH